MIFVLNDCSWMIDGHPVSTSRGGTVTLLASWSLPRVGIDSEIRRLATTDSGKTLAGAGDLLLGGRRR